MATSHSMTNNLPQLTHPDGSPIRALVVDDEPSLSELMSMGLRMAGWSVAVAADGPEAVKLAKEFRPDVLVLDVMLPGFDGVELLGRIRAFAPEVPALFLTAKDAVQDRIVGLAAGGDDYVTKPFSMEEVLLRLHRLVQRSGVAAMDTAELVVGDLVLNVDTREVTRAGEELQLTATQFELLRYLMENPKRVISKAQILDRVWNYDFGGQANIVELYISYLRKKVDASAPAHDPHRPRRGLRHQAGGLAVSNLSGEVRTPGRSWLNPATWHLRTRLVLRGHGPAGGHLRRGRPVQLCLHGLVPDPAAGRAAEPGLQTAPTTPAGPPLGNSTAGPIPLEARGQGVGTLERPDPERRRSAAPASSPRTPPALRSPPRTSRSSWR